MRWPVVRTTDRRNDRGGCTGSRLTAALRARARPRGPPLLATRAPTAGTRLTAFKLASIAGSGGTRQVTYNGHPLYVYPGDLITLRS